MTDKLEIGTYSMPTMSIASTDIGDALFLEYESRYIGKKKEVREETRSSLDTLVTILHKSSLRGFEKGEKPKYDSLKLSFIAKTFLEKNHAKIIQENPDSSCIIIYRQGKDGEKSQAIRLCIPRLNPGDKIIHTGGFTLKPLPRSNGYNTEYEIRDVHGNDWSQLAVLFPIENQKYKEKELLQSLIDSSSQKAHLLEGQLKNPKINPTQNKKLCEELSMLRRKITTARGEFKQYNGVNRYIYFSYIPYREGLNILETRNQGFDYLSSMMKRAYNQKFQNQSLGNIESSIKGKTISETLPWQYPLILNLIERMDFWLYFDRKMENLQSMENIRLIMKVQIEKSLTTFAANTSDAFNYQKSKAGAQGVGQIMPDTYQSFQDPKPTKGNPSPEKKYMQFFPESDFDIASRDHASSFRLQIAHFDSQIFQFPKGIRENWNLLMQDESTSIGLIALLAAGYNGSMRRIVDEVFGDILKNPPSDRQILLNRYKERLNSENIIKYMKKARDVDIDMILSQCKTSSYFDGKNQKYTQPIISPKAQGLIDKRMATYKESMTYVLKAEYVWKYLKLNYPGKF